MKTIIHKSDSRGVADYGWLKSHHTFSFSNYHNPERMNFGALRVLNDDVVQPKMGFGTHAHKNMEIISIPLSGALSHKDNLGNKRAINVGEVQVMSAGTGVTHSEFNDSKNEATNFLQLWILPEEMNVVPNYEQFKFDALKRHNAIQTIVAPKDKLEADALPISQQAFIYRTYLDTNKAISLSPKHSNNGFYVFVINGELNIDTITLHSRDAVGVWDTKKLTLLASKTAEVIIIETPMH